MADRTELRKFGTFALDGTNGIVLKSWRGRLLKEAKFSGRLRGEGSIVGRDRLLGQTVNMAGTVIGSDTEALRDNVDALVTELANGEQFLQFYTDRRIACRLDSAVKVDVGPLGSTSNWSARFRSRSPWWEGPTPVNDNPQPTGAGPHTLTTAAAILGTAPAFPVIKILSNVGFTAKNLLLTNTATVEQIHFLGLSMNAGQELIIDMGEGWLGDGVASSVTPRSIEGTWFPLYSGATATLELAHNVGAGADWDINIDYVPKFWTL